MPRNELLVSAACLVFLFGCASRQKTDAPPPAASGPAQTAGPKAQAPAATTTQPAKVAAAPAARTDGRKVKSKDGKTEGEIFGKPGAKSKFARLEIGMSRTVVEKMIGVPDDADTHVTGRTFTPFYYGGDTRRHEAFYRNEGQLTYSNGSRYSAPDTLIVISVDAKATGRR